MLKHSIEKHRENVTQENFKIIAKNFGKMVRHTLKSASDHVTTLQSNGLKITNGNEKYQYHSG